MMELPQPSTAVLVLVVVSVQLTRFTTSLTNVTVGVPQASVAVTKVTSAAGTVALQPRERVAGQVIDDGVTTTIDCCISSCCCLGAVDQVHNIINKRHRWCTASVGSSN